MEYPKKTWVGCIPWRGEGVCKTPKRSMNHPILVKKIKMERVYMPSMSMSAYMSSLCCACLYRISNQLYFFLDRSHLLFQILLVFDVSSHPLYRMLPTILQICVWTKHALKYLLFIPILCCLCVSPDSIFLTHVWGIPLLINPQERRCFGQSIHEGQSLGKQPIMNKKFIRLAKILLKKKSSLGATSGEGGGGSQAGKKKQSVIRTRGGIAPSLSRSMVLGILNAFAFKTSMICVPMIYITWSPLCPFLLSLSFFYLSLSPFRTMSHLQKKFIFQGMTVHILTCGHTICNNQTLQTHKNVRIKVNVFTSFVSVKDRNVTESSTDI